jgi:hypothetical protein
MPSDIRPTRNNLATGMIPAREVISAGSSVSGRMPTATRCRDRRSGSHRAGTYSMSRAPSDSRRIRPRAGAFFGHSAPTAPSLAARFDRGTIWRVSDTWPPRRHCTAAIWRNDFGLEAARRARRRTDGEAPLLLIADEVKADLIASRARTSEPYESLCMGVPPMRLMLQPAPKRLIRDFQRDPGSGRNSGRVRGVRFAQ